MPNLTPMSYGIVALISALGILHQWGEGGIPWWRLALIAWLVGLAYEWAKVRGYRIDIAAAGSVRLRLGREEVLSLVLRNSESVPVAVQLAPDLPEAFELDREARTLRLDPARSQELRIEVR